MIITEDFEDAGNSNTFSSSENKALGITSNDHGSDASQKTEEVSNGFCSIKLPIYKKKTG